MGVPGTLPIGSFSQLLAASRCRGFVATGTARSHFPEPMLNASLGRSRFSSVPDQASKLRSHQDLCTFMMVLRMTKGSSRNSLAVFLRLFSAATALLLISSISVLLLLLLHLLLLLSLLPLGCCHHHRISNNVSSNSNNNNNYQYFF